MLEMRSFLGLGLVYLVVDFSGYSSLLLLAEPTLLPELRVTLA